MLPDKAQNKKGSFVCRPKEMEGRRLMRAAKTSMSQSGLEMCARGNVFGSSVGLKLGKEKVRFLSTMCV